MKTIISTTKILFITLFVYSAAYGQENAVPQNIADRLQTFSAQHVVEKAYLQFDKPYYAAGDTMYFKGYVTRGEQHMLTNLSGVLHVDLINTANKIDQSIKLKIDSGLAWGDFAIPDSLPKGNYRVRAYTSWMRNNEDAGFFEKIITIGSPKIARIPESIGKHSAQFQTSKPDIQFFPEGGTLVAGIGEKVAFKAIGANGLGVNVRGTVVDNDNKEVASFASAHLGMGYFYLTPTVGKSYKAKVNYPDGTQDILDLSPVVASGVLLSVNNDAQPHATVLIKTNPAFYRENQGKAYSLVIYSQGTVATVDCKLDSAEIKLDILKRKLHTGIATITLFSADHEPLSERLIFIQNYDELNLNVNSDKKSYAPREKVNVRLNVINRKGYPADGHFSVSVINETNVPDDGKGDDNILTSLLLTSDLKGYVEHPAYYFADTSAIARGNLDVLMLTQGYRRFTWNMVLNDNSAPLAYQPETGLEINGQVKNVFGNPVKNGAVTLLAMKGGPVLTNVTDDKGMFSFRNLLFTDTTHFMLSAVNAKGKNNTKLSYFNEKPELVKPDRRQAAQITADSVMAKYVNYDASQQSELVKYGKLKGVMLKEVKIKDKKIDNQYRTQSFAGAGFADQVMHGDEIEQIQGPLATSLNGRLRGILFLGKPGQQRPYLQLSYTGPMLVIIDGDEGGDLNNLDAADVETVEVLKSANAAIYGMAGGNGVLVITTRPGGRDPRYMPSFGVLPVAVVGFYKAKEFYSPKYDAPSQANKQRDLRSTIYWKPEIKTDMDGNASFDYYNADSPGTYKIVIEGIDGKGNLGSQVYRYSVE